MNMKNIVLTSVLILCIVLTIPDFAFCNETDVKAHLYFGKETVSPGEILKVCIKLTDTKQEYKTNSVTFEIEYDADVFELVRNDPQLDIKNGYVEFTTRNNLGEGKTKRLKVMYVNTSGDIPLLENKTLFYAKFRVKKEAQSGDKSFKLNPVKMLDSNFKVYSVNKEEAIQSTITIVEKDSFSKGRKFDDVKENHWAKEFIDELVARRITFGVNENHFNPRGVVTRAQFAAFLVRALDIEKEDYSGEFKDVNADDWYAKEVTAAFKSGIVKGYGDGMFKPDQQVTREQMCSMVMAAYKYEMDNKQVAIDNSALKFTDFNNISSWADESVKEAYSLGIIKGMTATTFEPQKTALREQASAIIVKLLEACELL